MATGQLNGVIQHIRGAMLLRDGAGLTDGQLLKDYISRRDEAALAALVRRHGPTVWAVCRRVLRNYHDAEDAFQATFLVLVRRATSIAAPALLANWLYGVAHQTALKARATLAKRNVRERHVLAMPEPAVVEQDLWNDLQALLDRELSRLPDIYRVVIVLCDLEGKTRKQAARHLGLPEGTVGSRLARARMFLAKRLTERGVTLSCAGLAAVLAQNVASAGVPSLVVSKAIKVASLFAAGQVAATGPVSVKVAALTEGVLKAMLLNKLKTAMTVLFVVFGMIVFGGGLYMCQAVAQQGPTDNSLAVGQKSDKEGEGPAKAPPKNFTNSLAMKFVWIPPGNFKMGSPKEEAERGRDETQHKVTLTKGFYMGVYTVTQEQWQEVMGDNPSRFKGENNLPVDFPSWDDCQEFIKKLREKDKKPYRLPTEAEWEYACRAGTTTPFHFGETISTDQANYEGDQVYGNGKVGKNRNKTTPVGTFPANAWGLHDMHGNVYQWCQDRYGAYPSKDVVDPQGPDTATIDRVMRGGSFMSTPWQCRSADRRPYNPGTRCYEFGFRLCFFEETPQKQEKESFTAWGKEVGGLQAGLGYLPGERRAYHYGETVTLVVRLRNVGKEEVKFSYLQPFIEHAPLVTDGEGKLVPQPDKLYEIGARLPGGVELAPGKEIELHELKRELKPASESGSKKAQAEGRLHALYGTGKVSVEYEQVLGMPSMGYPGWKLDPVLSKLATGKLELEIKTDPPPAIEKKTPQEQEKERDLGKIQPPGGVPLIPSRGVITVDALSKINKRLEAAPEKDLAKWVVQLERITDKKPDAACLTYFVEKVSVAFDDLKWNAKTADNLFQRAQTMPPSEAKVWKEAFEALRKNEIEPAYAVPLVLIPVEAFHEGQKYSVERGKKYRARLKQLTADDVSLWKNKVDNFGGTELDAAVNIILLDDYFDKETFQRDKFRAAIGARKKQEQRAD
jgi:RNA polymerase sigma factor (sigma-70 family)